MNTELKSFEEIKQLTDYGVEYWSARDLQKPLGYERWENFSKVIDKAMLACDTAGFDVKDHFPSIRKTVVMPSKTSENKEDFGFRDVTKTKTIIDYKLSRYACYFFLIISHNLAEFKIVSLENEEEVIGLSRGFAGKRYRK